MNEAIIDVGIYVTYGLFGLAALAAVLFPLVFLFTDLKKAKNALIGIVVLAIVMFIGFSMASNEVYEGFAVSPLASKWIGGGIYATIILVGLAVVAAVYTEVARIFK